MDFAQLLALEHADKVAHTLSAEKIAPLKAYVDHGRQPGDFLLAVLSNDLTAACGRADVSNRRLLPEYIEFLYNYAPSNSWGSPAKVIAWLNSFKK